VFGQDSENIFVILWEPKIHVGGDVMADIDDTLHCNLEVTLSDRTRVGILAERLLIGYSKFA